LKAVVEDGAERGRLARRLTDTAGCNIKFK